MVSFTLACLLQAQEVLLDEAWNQEVLVFEQWKAMLGKDATIAFKGPRVKMSIVQDIPTSIGPHPDTGCAMYHGPLAGRLASSPHNAISQCHTPASPNYLPSN